MNTSQRIYPRSDGWGHRTGNGPSLRQLVMLLAVVLLCASCTPLLFPINPLLSANDAAFAETHFPGKWCGKWDGIFAVCYTITHQQDKVYEVLYEWEEVTGEPYQRETGTGVLINKNTLRFGATYIKIDTFDSGQGAAFGIFFTNSRATVLEKVGG